MAQPIISPSIMCADLGNLERDIKLLEETGADMLHFDVMDGHFVPNLTMGPDIINAVRNISDLPFEIHFTVDDPDRFMDMFDIRKNDIICVHQEAAIHLQRVLQKIKSLGAKTGVALNPATPIETLKYVLDDLDMILIMTVNPGYTGQKLITSTLKKIEDAKHLVTERNLDILIEVDGNVSFENAVKMRKAGADIFVAGTSSIFKKNLTIKDAAKKLRLAVE